MGVKLSPFASKVRLPFAFYVVRLLMYLLTELTF